MLHKVKCWANLLYMQKVVHVGTDWAKQLKAEEFAK